MDIQRAEELLTTLANGINPLTGEALSAYDSCNQVDVVRALYTVLAEVDKQPSKKEPSQPENAGKPWTTDEEAKLLHSYRNGCNISELSKIHKRTKGSISARLVKLGEIKEQSEAR